MQDNQNIDLNEFWSFIEEKLKSTFEAVSYDTWVKSAKPVALEDNRIIIEVNNAVAQNYWEKNIAQKVVEVAFEHYSTDITPVIKLESEVIPATQTNDNSPNISDRKPAALNNKYTFEKFVTGSGNQMAHAAALVVSEEPGVLYNPLFIYGGVGLGKTHLMQAIGHQLLKKNPDANVKYVTSETFANDFISSIQNQTQNEFRNAYRTVDLLMVDDIQFFADKEGTQEEFFHTFNELFNNKKQIVLTSDRLPNDIPKLEERLVSRFKWGLSVDITAPDLETRIAILRNKADYENLEIPDETLSYIAAQIDSNVRELEGALVRVQAYSAMNKSDINTTLAAEAMKGLKLSKKKKGLTISRIQDRVAKYYKISVEDIKGKKRVHSIVIPRQIAMYLARELTEKSLPQIGQEFGGKDHTTVMHSFEKINEELKINNDLQRTINDLKNDLKN
ncbi:chromosomal replication initiator protein DnaA [Companilactobacillus sp. RD055328]|uniref:chromosomal replication initiator protein DnaA n=1 Tax=Companilactobacillus sp. RD055328 TaxID=2916634 RepID=UPI001FC8412C|nr:chromosomal replication initiator protein DnaA [Companilactobacillus sp. RD055328]GKQ43409.1 chromosomal replication initiator protein DnaA [Companilactobacillus sp. RD055328]